MQEYKENQQAALLSGHYEIICRDKNGNFKWKEDINNIVVNLGLDTILVSTLTGGTRYTTWYVGLTAASPTPAAADVMDDHAGWTEFTDYDEANRPTWTPGSVAAQSVNNSASKAVFTISTNSSSIGGAFLVSNNTKSGTTGVLYSVGAFSGGNKSADDGDTLSVTATFSSADDGV